MNKSISCPDTEAYQVVHPYRGAPYREEEIACRQVESQHDLLVARIQEAGLVEARAYLSRMSEFAS
jgi:hypothetical protein